MLVAQYSLSQLVPAFGRELAMSRNVRMPYGGPTGAGGTFPKGTVLGCVAGTVQSEVATLTLANTTGGTFTVSFTADKVYQTASLAYNVSLANFKTALEAWFGTGNVAVTGIPGSSYVVTFQNQLANTRIGGLFAADASALTSGTTATATWARTTRGSSGAGQFDKYLDAGTNSCPTTARAILAHDYLSTPQGEMVGEGLRTGQAYAPLAFMTGFFNVGDLTGLDANGVADTGWRIVEGTAITDTGAVIGLGV